MLIVAGRGQALNLIPMLPNDALEVRLAFPFQSHAANPDPHIHARRLRLLPHEAGHSRAPILLRAREDSFMQTRRILLASGAPKDSIVHKKLFTLAILLGAGAFSAGAWDYEGHHAINELALASLPADFGGFTLTPAMKTRIEFLAGEPDRWRNTGDLPLKHVNGPDHYLDLENLKLYGLTPETLPLMRYDFAADIARARTAHPEKFSPIDPARDADHTRELGGFLPWAVTENYEKLKSCFSYLKTFQKHGGTRDEIANAEANVVYVMGVMGHYVGDGSQPLHTTMHFNGWVGDNPHGYTTSPKFHVWIDGGYFRQTGGMDAGNLAEKIHPAAHIGNAGQPDGMFRDAVAWLVEQNKLVEPLYQLDKEGKLSGEGEKGLEGRAFLDGQLVKAGQMLGDIWYTAWLEAPEDPYLQKQLQGRSAPPARAEKIQ
jgi:hypothetical protein